MAKRKTSTPTEYDRILGARLLYRMTVSDMPVEVVCQALEVTPWTLRRHLRGEVKINAEQAARYALLFGIDANELLPRLDSNQQPTGTGIAA